MFRSTKRSVQEAGVAYDRFYRPGALTGDVPEREERAQTLSEGLAKKPLAEAERAYTRAQKELRAVLRRHEERMKGQGDVFHLDSQIRAGKKIVAEIQCSPAPQAGNLAPPEMVAQAAANTLPQVKQSPSGAGAEVVSEAASDSRRSTTPLGASPPPPAVSVGHATPSPSAPPDPSCFEHDLLARLQNGTPHEKRVEFAFEVSRRQFQDAKQRQRILGVPPQITKILGANADDAAWLKLPELNLPSEGLQALVPEKVKDAKTRGWVDRLQQRRMLCLRYWDMRSGRPGLVVLYQGQDDKSAQEYTQHWRIFNPQRFGPLHLDSGSLEPHLANLNWSNGNKLPTAPSARAMLQAITTLARKGQYTGRSIYKLYPSDEERAGWQRADLAVAEPPLGQPCAPASPPDSPTSLQPASSAPSSGLSSASTGSPTPTSSPCGSTQGAASAKDAPGRAQAGTAVTATSKAPEAGAIVPVSTAGSKPTAKLPISARRAAQGARRVPAGAPKTTTKAAGGRPRPNAAATAISTPSRVGRGPAVSLPAPASRAQNRAPFR